METKSIFTSLTFWSLVATVVSEAAKRYGITIDQAGFVNDAISLVSIGAAMYGRFRASQPLHVIPPEVKPS